MEENRSSSNIPPERYVGIYSRTHAGPAAVSSPGGGDGGGGDGGCSLEGGLYVSYVPDPSGRVYFVRPIFKTSAGFLTL